MTDMLFEPSPKSGFPLTQGTVIKVPPGAAFVSSKNADRFPDTPLCASVRPVKDSPGRYEFAVREGRGGIKLFVPPDLVAGDQIEIVWGLESELTCACARRLTAAV